MYQSIARANAERSFEKLLASPVNRIDRRRLLVGWLNISNERVNARITSEKQNPAGGPAGFKSSG